MKQRLVHGGDWAGFAESRGFFPLDYSANISPLGVPEGVKQALQTAVEGADRYPDPLCRALRRALSEHEGIPAEFIQCGNGAADLIFRAVYALRPRRALVTAPTFAEYESALRNVDCVVDSFLLRAENGFQIGEDILDAIVPDTDLVFLCEPNNPTGVTTDRALIYRILERCREVGARLMVDECFCDFLDDPAGHTMKNCVEGYPNLLILKAFTKLYAMAGVRLGYVLCADLSLMEGMRLAGQPWGVSSLAQAAGVAALKECAYVDAVRSLIGRERPKLMAALEELGLKVIPGEANYLLFQCGKPLCEPLQERGILIRSCANYPGLDCSWYRIAVRGDADNARLVAALKEVLG